LLQAVHWRGRTVAIRIESGRVAAIDPIDGPARVVLAPDFVDPHVHLDKTFTAHRVGRPEPGLLGAIAAMARDRSEWTEADVRERAVRALIEAEAAGVAALRTHVDWTEPATPLAWRALQDVAQDWANRLIVQRASLSPIDLLAEAGATIADEVARTQGVLGAFVYPTSRLSEKIEAAFDLAQARGLALDFHVDESLDPLAHGFDVIARETLARGLGGRVLCGHACALSIRPPDEVARALDLAARAGVALTALPSTNAWLQDMATGVTPRRRGIAPIKEARAAGVTTLLGADNVADAFYPYGCYDPLETLRLAATLAQLDLGDWIEAISTDAAGALGVPRHPVAVGATAHFLLLEAADWTQAARRPGVSRRRVRAGVVSAPLRPLEVPHE
jgi:cytosine deaminase